MLAVKSYPQSYIDECRTRTRVQLAAHKKLVTAAGTKAQSAAEAFDPLFFNNLTLVLDYCFVHRTRALEGKDGNPLNEVRMLCNSLLSDNGVLSADKTIKYDPETSVLKLQIGDEIRLDEKQFRRLFDASFAEIEEKFS